MMKTGIALLLVSVAIASCGEQKARMSENERDVIVDSIIGTKMEELNRQSMEDLDKRMAIEVKAKADSIVMSIQDSFKKDAAPPDNTIPNNLPVP